MRSLITVTALVLLVATSASAAGGRPNPFEEHAAALAYSKGRATKEAVKAVGEDHKKMLKQIWHEMKQVEKHGHDYVAQQTELLAPVSDEPQCKETSFSTTMFAVFQTCLGPLATFPMSFSYDTDVAAKSSWDAYCSTQCAADLKTKIVNADIEVCVHPDVREFSRTSAFMCDTKSSTNAEMCGVHYHRVMRYSGCGSQTSTSCAAQSDVCESYTNTYAIAYAGQLYTGSTPMCRSVYSSSVSAGVCEGGCHQGLMTEIKTANPRSATRSALKVLESMNCAKDTTGSYCTATMSASRNAFDDGTVSKTTFDTMCASKDIVGCYKKLLGVSSGFSAKTAKQNFVACAIGVNNVTSSINTQCLSTFKSNMKGVGEARQLMSKLCIKNAAGDYCTLYQGALSANACASIAWNTYMRNSCTISNASCTTVLQGTISAMGCCAGTIQESFTRAAHLDVEDYPKVIGYTAVAEDTTQLGTTAPITLASNEEDTVYAGPGYIADGAFCGVTGLNETLRKRCKLATLKIAKKMGLKIRWSALANDATLKAKVQRAIKTDVADNLGVSVDEIINDELVENSNIQVTTATGHAMAVQSSSGSGTNYEFEVQASDETSTTAAGETFDTLETNDEFVMTETQSTTSEECADSCTNADDDGLTTSSSSGAASAFAMSTIALIVGLVALI